MNQISSSEELAPCHFPKFLDLPKEIRDKIWQLWRHDNPRIATLKLARNDKSEVLLCVQAAREDSIPCRDAEFGWNHGFTLGLPLISSQNMPSMRCGKCRKIGIIHCNPEKLCWRISYTCEHEYAKTPDGIDSIIGEQGKAPRWDYLDLSSDVLLLDCMLVHLDKVSRAIEYSERLKVKHLIYPDDRHYPECPDDRKYDKGVGKIAYAFNTVLSRDIMRLFPNMETCIFMEREYDAWGNIQLPLYIRRRVLYGEQSSSVKDDNRTFRYWTRSDLLGHAWYGHPSVTRPIDDSQV